MCEQGVIIKEIIVGEKLLCLNELYAVLRKYHTFGWPFVNGTGFVWMSGVCNVIGEQSKPVEPH